MFDGSERIGTAELTITPVAGGPRLAATLYLPPCPDPGTPGLVVGHGAGSWRQRHAPFCRIAAAHGLAVLAFDFRGHGESEGRMDGEEYRDVVAAADAIRRHPAVVGAIGYRGSSMGAYNGLLAARSARLDALALLCPADEAALSAGLAGLEAGAFPEPAADRVDFPGIRAGIASHHLIEEARAVSAPVLLLHARGDEIVPLAVSLRLAEALPGPVEVVLMPGGDHSALQGDASVHERTAAWLSARLREA